MIKQNTIPAVILSAFALTAIFAVTVQGSTPTPTPASRSEPTTIRKSSGNAAQKPWVLGGGRETQKAEGETSTGASENPKSETTRTMPDMPLHLKTQKAQGEPQANPKRAIAAINRNKNEHDAIVAAVKSQNASEIQAILGRHGIVLAPKRPIVMRQNGYCYNYMCGSEPDGSPRYCMQCVEVSHSGYIRD